MTAPTTPRSTASADAALNIARSNAARFSKTQGLVKPQWHRADLFVEQIEARRGPSNPNFMPAHAQQAAPISEDERARKKLRTYVNTILDLVCAGTEEYGYITWQELMEQYPSVDPVRLVDSLYLLKDKGWIERSTTNPDRWRTVEREG